MIARSVVILLNCRIRVLKPQVIGTEKERWNSETDRRGKEINGIEVESVRL
jgi:hypothetical protein